MKAYLVAFGANTNGDIDSYGKGSLTHMKPIDLCFDEKFRIISNSVNCNQSYLKIDKFSFWWIIHSPTKT